MNQKFHERFAIKINREEAERRFVNRAHNLVFGDLDDDEFTKSQIATALGEKYEELEEIEEIIQDDFHNTLKGLEMVFHFSDDPYKSDVEKAIRMILHESEIDLGIKWENGRFIPSGAKMLDEKLVNESLRWLSDKEYESVLDPFSKGLEHFVHAVKRPDLLSDVITDMYEALEALSKIVTGKDKDLSANAELVIKKLRVSKSYKNILKDYISYANGFRHAQKEGGERPRISIREVESFIYLTGLFIRLATQTQAENE